MAKIKNENRGFESIPKALINDDTLSDRARFLYCYMSSKPDWWEFYLDNVAKSLHLGRDTVQKYIKELIMAGWIEKGEQQNENGKFGAVEYVIKAFKDKPTVEEKYRYGKIHLQNNSSINTPINNISSINTPDNDNNKRESISKSRFQKPKIEEVEAYIKEKKMHFNATEFYDHYEAVGWMVGLNHMKDWKASCRTWENKRKAKSQEEEEKEELPEGLDRQVWEKCRDWFISRTPRISGYITPDVYLKIKGLAKDSRELADIILYIEASGYNGDIVKEFSRLKSTGEYKPSVVWTEGNS